MVCQLAPDPPSDIDLNALETDLHALVAPFDTRATNVLQSAYNSTYGTLLYRMGDFHRAIEALEKAMSLWPNSADKNDDDGTPFEWVILSMCHSRLSNLASATKWLSKTEERLRQVKKDPFYDDPVWDWSWEQKVYMDRLLAEARVLLDGGKQKGEKRSALGLQTAVSLTSAFRS